MISCINEMLIKCTIEVKSNLDILIQYVYDNFNTLSNELSEYNFQIINDILVDQIATNMLNFIQINIEVNISIIYLFYLLLIFIIKMFTKTFVSLSYNCYHSLTEK